MMCWACPSTTMWRSLPRFSGRRDVGWIVMLAGARWWAFFPPPLPVIVCPWRCVGDQVMLAKNHEFVANSTSHHFAFLSHGHNACFGEATHKNILGHLKVSKTVLLIVRKP